MKHKLMIIVLTALLIMSGASLAFAQALSPELCKAKAKAAAALLKAKGDAALAELNDPNGEFRFAGGKGYVWVHNLDGVMVMHPIKPALVGKGLMDMRDVNGVYLFVAMNELCEDKGEGWVPYSWPKPGEEKSSPKVSYVVLVEKGDKTYVVGSGMYDVTPQDIKKNFPADAVYEDD
jgi:signal transduction histidine kinase